MEKAPGIVKHIVVVCLFCFVLFYSEWRTFPTESLENDDNKTTLHRYGSIDLKVWKALQLIS